MMKRWYEAISRTGTQVTEVWRSAVDLVGLLLDTLAAVVRTGRGRYRSLFGQIVSQILFTGYEALWLVGFIALLTGATVVVQATANMPRYGVSEYFGKLLIMFAVNQLGPFFTALVVIGRSGAALAAYVGNMRVTREIDALEVMGIDPVRFIVLPAFWGFVVGMTCLNLYFALVAIVGGLLVAGVTVNLALLPSLAKVMEALTFNDALVCVLKGILFGIPVSIVSSYYGLNVRSIRGVPQASIKSVVLSMAAVIAVNAIITVVINALQPAA